MIAVVDQWQKGDYSSYGTRFEKNNILIFDPRTEKSRFTFESDYRTFESLYVSDSNFMFNLVDFNSPMVDSEKWRTSTYKLNLYNLKLTKVSGNSNNFDQYGRPAGFVLIDKTEDLAQFYEINGNVISIGYFPFFGMKLHYYEIEKFLDNPKYEKEFYLLRQNVSMGMKFKKDKNGNKIIIDKYRFSVEEYVCQLV